MTLRGRHALVVDDDGFTRDLMQRLLAEAGFKAYSVENADEALNILGDAPVISIALVDYYLPDMNGIELMKILRTISSDMTLIMLTVCDESSLIEKAFAAGANIFMVKPCGLMELFAGLRDPASKFLHCPNFQVIDVHGLREYKMEQPFASVHFS